MNAREPGLSGQDRRPQTVAQSALDQPRVTSASPPPHQREGMQVATAARNRVLVCIHPLRSPDLCSIYSSSTTTVQRVHFPSATAVMASSPNTPPADQPTDLEAWRLIDTGAPCEWAKDYRPGDFHPVNLGTSFPMAGIRSFANWEMVHTPPCGCPSIYGESYKFSLFHSFFMVCSIRFQRKPSLQHATVCGSQDHGRGSINYGHGAFHSQPSRTAGPGRHKF